MFGDSVSRPAGGTVARRRERFECLWRENRPRVWRLLLRLTGDPDAADDLTQEVSVRAFGAFAGFRGEAGAATWLYRIAVNVAARHRQCVRGGTVGLDTPEAAGLCATGGGPEEAALRGALVPAVRAAVERLPEEMRTTLILQVYEGLKYREIAAVLGVPVGTVKSRLHQATQRLRETLRDYQGYQDYQGY